MEPASGLPTNGRVPAAGERAADDRAADERAADERGSPAADVAGGPVRLTITPDSPAPPGVVMTGLRCDGALHDGRADRRSLQSTVDGWKRRPGSAVLRSALRRADGRAESPAQTLARLRLLPVLPDLEPQVELFDAAARLVARFDLGDRRVRLAVEADGKAGHAGPAMVAKDRRRDRRTTASGGTRSV